MRTACAWCGKLIAGEDLRPDQPTSHGICPACLAVMQAEFHKLHAPEQVGNSAHDRRSSNRRPCLLAVSCRRAESGASFPAVVANLSPDGLQLVGQTRLPERSLVEVGAAAGGAWPAAYTARVVWSAPGAGGAWVSGCTLPSPLTEPELQRCLAAEPPG